VTLRMLQLAIAMNVITLCIKIHHTENCNLETRGISE
jgi:hypothetical protein